MVADGGLGSPTVCFNSIPELESAPGTASCSIPSSTVEADKLGSLLAGVGGVRVTSLSESLASELMVKVRGGTFDKSEGFWGTKSSCFSPPLGCFSCPEALLNTSCGDDCLSVATLTLLLPSASLGGSFEEVEPIISMASAAE